MIYFIDESFVKEYSPVQDNVDMKNVEHNLVTIFDLRIKKTLGSYFAIYLLDKYNVYRSTNVDNFTAKEKELIKLIQKTMAWEFAYNAYYDLSWQLSNKGAVQGSSDFYTPTQDATTKFKAERAYENSAEYKSTMERFICENEEAFPQFTNELNSDRSIWCDCGCGSKGDSIYVAFT